MIYHIGVECCSSTFTNRSEITMQSSYAGLGLFILLMLYVSCTICISSTNREMNSFSSIHKEKVNHPCLMNIKKKSVDCSDKDLRNIPQDLNPDIENLDLEINRIKYLRNTSFQKYSHLIQLNLHYNQILLIQEGTFYPLVDLTRLDLSYNHDISYLPRGSFQKSLRLQWLDLEECNLTSFSFTGAFSQGHNHGVGNTGIDGKSSKNFPFHDRQQIDFLNLASNSFTNLTRETIAIDWNVYTLVLDDNPIQTVDPDAIASLHVKWLQFSSYPLSLQVIKNITLGVSKSTVIETLDFLYSNITHIPSDLFEHLRNKSLATLSLEGNDIVLYSRSF